MDEVVGFDFLFAFALSAFTIINVYKLWFSNQWFFIFFLIDVIPTQLKVKCGEIKLCWKHNHKILNGNRIWS